MGTKILLRRGPTNERLKITPIQGELIFDTDTNQIYVGDGVTPGGLLVNGQRFSEDYLRHGLDYSSGQGTSNFERPETNNNSIKVKNYKDII